MGVVTFNGQSSAEYGILVEHPPGYHIPERDYEYIHVPGRNGDLIIDKGSYQNGTREYEIAFGDLYQDYAPMANKVARWLHSASGYARLEDTYEPDYYRQASYVDSVDIENILFHAGRATIEFNCKPQRYLKSGESAVTLTFTQQREEIQLNVERYKFYRAIETDGVDRAVITTTASSEYYIAIVGVRPGETYYYTGRAYNFKKQYSLMAIDNNDIVLKKELGFEDKEEDLSYTDYSFVIPDGATRLIVQSYQRAPVLQIDGYSNTINNPTSFASNPLIRVYTGTAAQSNQYIRLNGVIVIGFSSFVASTNPLIVDCDLQDVYQGAISRNSITELPTGRFPQLLPGENVLGVSSGIQKLEIIPRWWTL